MDPLSAGSKANSSSIEQSNPSASQTQRESSSSLNLSRTASSLSLVMAHALPSPPRLPVAVNNSLLKKSSDHASGDEASNISGNTVPTFSEPGQQAPHSDSSSLSISKYDYLSDKLKFKILADNTIKVSFPKTITDEDIRRFFKDNEFNQMTLNQISEVHLYVCTTLTGSSLHLLGLKLGNVKKLDLTGCTQFTDADLYHLNLMSNMEQLSLAGCDQLSAAGFINLGKLLDNVKTLDLSCALQVDDQFLKGLENMYQIKNLVLTGCTGFTDKGLSSLRKLPNLKILTLDQCTQINDKSLERLARTQSFTELLELNVNNCPLVTNRGVLRLQAALPSQVRISH